MTFSHYIGADAVSRVIDSRIYQLAEEGFQHELNAKMLRERLANSEELTDEQRADMHGELEAINNRIHDIQGTIDWHENEKFLALKQTLDNETSE
jgi:S-methylmethionine-dependent homocysteine/selenocysteine methylase